MMIPMSLSCQKKTMQNNQFAPVLELEKTHETTGQYVLFSFCHLTMRRHKLVQLLFFRVIVIWCEAVCDGFICSRRIICSRLGSLHRLCVIRQTKTRYSHLNNGGCKNHNQLKDSTSKSGPDTTNHYLLLCWRQHGSQEKMQSIWHG